MTNELNFDNLLVHFRLETVQIDIIWVTTVLKHFPDIFVAKCAHVCKTCFAKVVKH